MSNQQTAAEPTDSFDNKVAEVCNTNPDMAATLRSFMALRHTVPPEPPAPEKPTTAKILQLPLWPEPVRRAPNVLLRSAFFAAIASKKRQRLGIPPSSPNKEPEGVIIAAQKGDTIKYAGTQLNQYDADVFFEGLHRARGNPLPTECIFTGYNFLKAIGRTPNNLNYEDLDDSLRRLRFGEVEIAWSINGRRYKFVGGLISNYVREEHSKLYKVTFAKTICDLFAPACWTQLEWDERKTLKGKPLAQWLHSFYSTHATCFPISVAYLHEKTGSQHTLLKNFRVDLKQALATLEKELGWKATWDGDLLTINRPPSNSQARHLLRAKPRKKTSARNPRRRTMTHVGDLLPGLPKPPETP